MGTPKGWPLGIAPEIADRYRTAIEALNGDRSWRQEQDEAMFDMALNVAIGECERARKYSWPDEAETNQQFDQYAELDTVTKLAGRLAKKLARTRRMSPVDVAIMTAFERADISVLKDNSYWVTYCEPDIPGPIQRREKDPKSCGDSWALYTVLESLSQVKPPEVRRYRFGALEVKGGMVNKGTRPGKATILAVCIMHKFRLLTGWKAGSGNFVTYNGTDLERTQGSPKSAIAAFFAAAAFDDEATAVQERAKAWLRDTKNSTVYYWGWGEKGTEGRPKK